MIFDVRLDMNDWVPAQSPLGGSGVSALFLFDTAFAGIADYTVSSEREGRAEGEKGGVEARKAEGVVGELA